MKLFRFFVFSFAFAMRGTLPLAAQTPAAQSNERAVTPVLKANANLVLLDVVVTDNNKAVRGIAANKFHVLEDGKEQTVVSFEEHEPVQAAPVTAQAMPPNTYSNKPVYPPSPSFNVLLLDGLNTPVENQMDVRRQMIDAVGKIAPGTQMAVFTLASKLQMVTGFTTDVAKLAQAVNSTQTLARTSDVIGSGLSGNGNASSDDMAANGSVADAASMEAQWEADITAFQTDQRMRMTLDAFQQLGMFLAGIPGRKNIIWFSAAFPIALDPDQSQRNAFDAARAYAVEMKETNEILAAARVAVYPVDARGLFGLKVADASYIPSGGIGGGGSGSFRRGPNMAGSGASTDSLKAMELNADEHASMEKIAFETGGHAYVNTNGLKEALADALANGSSYYTLSYTPSNSNYDGKFRRVQVRVDGGSYKIASRDGYYAEAAGKTGSQHPAQPSTILAATAHGAPVSSQILFNTRVLPATDAHFKDAKIGEGRAGAITDTIQGKTRRFVVDVLVDPRGLLFGAPPDGSHKANVEFTVVAYDAEGKRVNFVDMPVQFSFVPAEFAKIRGSGIPARMSIDVPSGAGSLRIAVQDLMAGRIGALEVPIPAAAK